MRRSFTSVKVRGLSILDSTGRRPLKQWELKEMICRQQSQYKRVSECAAATPKFVLSKVWSVWETLKRWETSSRTQPELLDLKPSVSTKTQFEFMERGFNTSYQDISSSFLNITWIQTLMTHCFLKNNLKSQWHCTRSTAHMHAHTPTRGHHCSWRFQFHQIISISDLVSGRITSSDNITKVYQIIWFARLHSDDASNITKSLWLFFLHLLLYYNFRKYIWTYSPLFICCIVTSTDRDASTHGSNVSFHYNNRHVNNNEFHFSSAEFPTKSEQSLEVSIVVIRWNTRHRKQTSLTRHADAILVVQFAVRNLLVVCFIMYTCNALWQPDNRIEVCWKSSLRLMNQSEQDV